MPRKIQRELPNRVGKISVLTRDPATGDVELLDKINEQPSPIGDISDLRTALSLLAGGKLTEEKAEHEIRVQVTLLLIGRDDHSPRLSDQAALLNEIETLARSLEVKLYRLTTPVAFTLERHLPATAFGNQIPDSPRWWNAMQDLEQLAEATKKAQADLEAEFGKDVGGKKLTMNRRAYGDPTRHFMQRMIRIFAKAHGSSAVTKTIPDPPGSGRSCYRFLDSAHMFATSEPLGRETEFKQRVDFWHAGVAKLPENMRL